MFPSIKKLCGCFGYVGTWVKIKFVLVNIKIVLVERKIARVKSKFSWIKIPIDTPNSILGKVTPVTLRATSAYKLGNSIIDPHTNVPAQFSRLYQEKKRNDTRGFLTGLNQKRKTEMIVIRKCLRLPMTITSIFCNNINDITLNYLSIFSN